MRPIIVLSDLHLGREDMVLSAEELLPLIERAGILIINGDAAELHVRQYAARARAELDRLHELCQTHGTRLLRLAGNHDPEGPLERYIIHPSSGVFITHGDVISEAVAPWSDAARTMRRQHRRTLAEFPIAQRNTIDARFHACREAAISEWNEQGDSGPPSTFLSVCTRPRKLYKVLQFWRHQIPHMNEFVQEYVPNARLVLIGHSHRPRIKRFGGRLFVNTGSFGFPGRPLAAVFDDAGFRVVRVVNQRNCWRLDDRSLLHDDSFTFDDASIQEADIGPRRSRADATTAASTPVTHPASSA